ncbi:MAG: hypothetical protein ACRCX2_13150 [Paraclostridium sp.]
MLKNNTFEDFLSKIGDKLNTNIDPSSLDIRIFRCFYDISSEISSKTDNEVKSMFFENLKGNDLDNVMEFFDTYRKRGGSSDLYSFNFYNGSEKSFFIKKGSYMNFESKSYKILQDTYINNGQCELVTQYSGNAVDISQPVFTKDGVVCFSIDSISGTFDTLHQQFTNSVKLSSYRVQNDEIESDFEFKEKSKSIMQSLGMSNSQKIKYELLKNNDIKTVIIKEETDLTKLIIVPVSLNNSNEIINYSKEVVDYYKGGNVVVEKPSVIEVDLLGVSELLLFETNAAEIKDTIVSSIIGYLSTNLSGSIQRNKIITIIQEVLNQKTSTRDFDINKISITYNFYSKDNYDTPIVVSKIDNYKTVDSNSVVTFGRLG